jgi:hypothetical protein
MKPIPSTKLHRWRCHCWPMTNAIDDDNNDDNIEDDVKHDKDIKDKEDDDEQEEGETDDLSLDRPDP